MTTTYDKPTLHKSTIGNSWQVKKNISIDEIMLINKNFTITPLNNAIMSAVAAAQRLFTKCRGHIAPLLAGYHKLSLVVCSLFIVPCQLSLVFARQTMCPVTPRLSCAYLCVTSVFLFVVWYQTV